MKRTQQQIVERRTKLVAALRMTSIIGGVYDLIFGEPLVGIAILLCVAAISLPSILTRGRIKALPLEIELILFFMVVLQFVIGETLNFYDNVPYFDKLVHFTLPFFLGFLSFLFAFTMQATGNLRMSKVPMVIVLVLITLGIGALWEIVEYLSDVFLGTYLQGSLTASPLVDTMNDLIADTLGGAFGALLGLRYMTRQAGEKDSRLSALTGELADDYAKVAHR